MASEHEAPERIWVQLTSNGSTISYIRDPREVHDNGKLVYQYVLAKSIAAAIATERERDAQIAEQHSATNCDGPDCGVVIAAAIRNHQDVPNPGFKLLFCDTCFSAQNHELVGQEWLCCGPSHGELRVG